MTLDMVGNRPTLSKKHIFIELTYVEGTVLGAFMQIFCTVYLSTPKLALLLSIERDET